MMRYSAALLLLLATANAAHAAEEKTLRSRRYLGHRQKNATSEEVPEEFYMEARVIDLESVNIGDLEKAKGDLEMAITEAESELEIIDEAIDEALDGAAMANEEGFGPPNEEGPSEEETDKRKNRERDGHITRMTPPDGKNLGRKKKSRGQKKEGGRKKKDRSVNKKSMNNRDNGKPAHSKPNSSKAQKQVVPDPLSEMEHMTEQFDTLTGNRGGRQGKR